MEDQPFDFVRLVGNERREGPTLASVSRHWQGDKESFLCISPHDDDVAIGGGLLMQIALREKVPVRILVVTDGSMGYCSEDEKLKISEIRREETFACYQQLGVKKENIIWLGFGDCRLASCQGRKAASHEDEPVIAGFTGLQNSFTYWLRKIGPTQCFLPTSNDLHPDHKIVHREFLISMFHAAGSIWPELGEPIEKIPYIHEIGVYCDFPEPPQLRMQAPQWCMDKKLSAIGAFKSQKQIAPLIDIVKRSGPYEYLRALDFSHYQPSKYHDRFEKKHTIPYGR